MAIIPDKKKSNIPWSTDPRFKARTPEEKQNLIGGAALTVDKGNEIATGLTSALPSPTEAEMDKRITDRQEMRRMGAEQTEILKSRVGQIASPVTTPMAPVNETMGNTLQPGQTPQDLVNKTNSTMIATAARDSVNRGGVTNVTPMGAVVQPLLRTANYSASGLNVNPDGQAVDATTRAKNEWAQYAASNNARRAAVDTTGMEARTTEDKQARGRQLEQDAINRKNQAQAKTLGLAKIQGKVDEEQAKGLLGLGSAYIAQGVQPDGSATLPARQTAMPGQEYEQGQDGIWRDKLTKQPAPRNVSDQLTINETKKRDLEAIRNLPPAKKSSSLNPFSVDNLYGYNPATGEFKEFDNPGQLAKDKKFLPFTTEQEGAYQEGQAARNKPAQAGGLSSAGQSQSNPAQGALPAAGTVMATGQPGPANHRSSILAETDPAKKKAMVLAARKAGQISDAELAEIVKENGL